MRPHAVLTGGAGFLGSHIAESLLARDVEVTCLDNFSTGSEANIAHLRGRNGFRLIKLDVTNYISIPGPVDYVLHFASPASPVDYAELPIQTLKVGALGTLNTLGLAMEKGARFLLASTSETYGDPLVHPQPESYWGNVNPVGPRGCYDEAKRFAEALTTAYRTKHGVNTAIMRIFNTFGPRMRPNDGRAIPNFISQALRDEPITVQGDGSQTRSVCYVDDLVNGALELLFSDLAGPVNIGNPHEMSVLELAELIRELAGSGSAVTFIERAQDDPAQRQPDITLARHELRWEPRVDVRDGLLQTITWFRERVDGAYPAPAAAPIGLPDRQSQPSHRVAVIGTGYVGAVTAACMAFLGHSVVGLDSDSARAAQLGEGAVPFVEPGLQELLAATLSSGRLRFTDDPTVALPDAEFVILCVGTPRGPDGSPDLEQLATAIQSMAPYLRSDAVIVNKSTVPVGSGNWTRTILEDALEGNRQLSFSVVSNPEFLREGSAIDDFFFPDRIVLGGSASDVNRVAELYQRVLDQSFDGGRRIRPALITTGLTSAEMIKYASNAFLATKISFANEIANMCELFGADVREVLPALGADNRIGSAFLNPGVGWGGSCFGKDVSALIASSQEYGYTPPMLGATVEINQAQRASAIRKLQRELHSLKGRRIALLGLAFKPGTDDLRDAPALDIARRLLAAGATVSAFDPVVKALPEGFEDVRLATDIYGAAERADAVVLATEWPEFRLIDPAGLRRVMRGDLIVDGRNCLPAAGFAGSGLQLVGFGW